MKKINIRASAHKTELIDALVGETLRNPQFNVDEWSLFEAEQFEKMAELIKRELSEKQLDTITFINKPPRSSEKLEVELNLNSPLPTPYSQMNISSIETEVDYKSALASIRKLWEAQPNTPEGDKLKMLITLVETYETKHDIMSERNKKFKN